MPREAFLAGCLVLILTLFARDIRRRPDVSIATWLVVVWAVIFASRPVSSWFDSGIAAASVDTYLEGSPTDRAVSLVLILAGYAVVLRRWTVVAAIARKNGALLAFYAFWALSITWSDYPFVAFKRWFKDFGAVIMVLVVLSERNPIEAVKAVTIRAAYLLVPMSFLFVRFYPEIGRSYTGYNQNELMYIGVATHKNTLGALLLVSCVFLTWDLTTREKTGRRLRFAWADSGLVLLMALWLLRIANSATSLACTFVGIGIYVITGIRFVKPTLRYVEVYGAVGAVLWWLADSVLHLTELVVTGLGRDMTLTTRTDAWQLFLSIDLNPLIGAGFKSFWAGERMARIWQDFPGIVQAHNGYIETYLEGGVLGLTFLAILMLAAFRAIKRSLVAGDDYARIRLAFWFVAVAYNFTEAAYTQLSLLWIVTLLIVTEGCEVAVAVSATKDVPPLDRPIRIQSPWRSAGPTAIRRQTKTVERSLS